MTDHICLNCIHYVTDECHRYAPIGEGWPRTRPHDRCGDFTINPERCYHLEGGTNDAWDRYTPQDRCVECNKRIDRRRLMQAGDFTEIVRTAKAVEADRKKHGIVSMSILARCSEDTPENPCMKTTPGWETIECWCDNCRPQ